MFQGTITVVNFPLLSASELLPTLDSPALRLIDVRKGDTFEHRCDLYRQGHIPGAIFMDMDNDLSTELGAGRHPMPSAREFAHKLASAGIGPEHQIVCYDNFAGAFAARAWWMLESLGHPSVKVLDGGIVGWQTLAYPVSREITTHNPSEWESPVYKHPTIDRANLASSLSGSRIIDARSQERYAGVIEPLDPVAGHIPGSLSAPFTDNLENGLFKSPDELRKRFSELGINSAEALVCTCGSGVTACHNILALRVAGLGQATLYPGSWSDWCTSDLPIEVGEGPDRV